MGEGIDQCWHAQTDPLADGWVQCRNCKGTIRPLRGAAPQPLQSDKYDAMYVDGKAANDIAYEEGADAFLEGKSQRDNPYTEPERHAFWQEGYEFTLANPDHDQCAHERGECHWGTNAS